MEKLQIALQALQDIIDPVGAIKSKIQPTEQLNGSYAILLSNDPNYLKDIAKEALRRIQNDTF